MNNETTLEHIYNDVTFTYSEMSLLLLTLDIYNTNTFNKVDGFDDTYRAIKRKVSELRHYDLDK